MEPPAPPPAAPLPAALPEEPPPLAVERGQDAERPLLVRPFFSFQVSTLESERVRVHHDPITSLGASLGWRRFKLSISKAVKVAPDQPDDDPDNPIIHSDALNISLAISVPVRRRELVLLPFLSTVKGVGIEANSAERNFREQRRLGGGAARHATEHIRRGRGLLPEPRLLL